MGERGRGCLGCTNPKFIDACQGFTTYCTFERQSTLCCDAMHAWCLQTAHNMAPPPTQQQPQQQHYQKHFPPMVRSQSALRTFLKHGCNSAEDEKENVDDKGKKPMREEDLPQEQAEADEEAADSPGSRTDMELAWENLEVAKYIYEHEPEGNHAKELAGNQFKG